MPRPETATARLVAGDALKPPLLAGAGTRPGQSPDRFLPLQSRRLAESGDAPPPTGRPRTGNMTATPTSQGPGAAANPPTTPAPAKPSRSRAREAHQQAVLGVRLARQGQHAQAIARLRRSVELDPTVATAQHDLGRACLEAGRFEEAVGALGNAVRLNPNLASAYDGLAVALDHLGRVDGALRAYEAAVRLAPERHTAQFRLGQLYLGRGRRREAEACFRSAAAATAGTAQSQISEACAADAAGEGAQAQALLRAVIVADPACGLAHLILGQVLAQAGQSAEAAACIERGIALQPDMIAAWQGFATNTRFTAADQALIERIRNCLERPNLTAWQRKAVHFALGKAHDDIGNYREAMRHFDSANRIRSSAAILDRVTLARQTGRMIASTPPGYLDRRPDLGVEDETPILIVGMPRSGTTLVEQILSSHPDVAPGGELGFWSERNGAGVGVFDATAKPKVVRNLADDYLAVLRAISPEAARVTDKMPFNFGLLGIIRQVFPRATIVHCRRHPVDTCLSIFTTDFDATIDFAGDRSSLVSFYRQYERLMTHWRDVLPPERFIEVDYEELVADPEPLSRRLVATCGLEWNDACLAPHRNQRRITTASLWQARQPIYRTSVERWKRYEPWLGELGELLSPDDSESTAAVK
jgi:tetratricopeptide (TPR) repeat protein